ncbi:hypothetical protein [Butyrivibrio sp. AE2015]|uniref:hypothetical protein n=1 Tax=Butyrivibrio sp. AE2015 TaxID=1280663 RepID=UPI0003B5BBDE|nr:hypothetical protein [Butyrivibrio sp. AE2015]
MNSYHPHYEIEIIDGTDPTSYFTFCVADIPKNEIIYDKDIKVVGRIISIEEGDVDCFLAYFLKKYYDPTLFYNSHQDLDDDEKEAFYWWLVENVYTYEAMSAMCDEIIKVADLLDRDFFNPELEDVKKEFSIFYMSDNDDIDHINSDCSPKAIHRHAYVVVDFYRRFVNYIRKMMMDHPECNLITISGP